MWEHRPRCEKGVEPEHLRTRRGCSYGSRRTPFLMQENPGLGVGAPPSVRKGVEPENLRTRGGCSSRSRGTPGFDVGESRFGCGSTALGAKGSRARAPSHPGAGAPTVREEPRF